MFQQNFVLGILSYNLMVLNIVLVYHHTKENIDVVSVYSWNLDLYNATI